MSSLVWSGLVTFLKIDLEAQRFFSTMWRERGQVVGQTCQIARPDQARLAGQASTSTIRLDFIVNIEPCPSVHLTVFLCLSAGFVLPAAQKSPRLVWVALAGIALSEARADQSRAD